MDTETIHTVLLSGFFSFLVLSGLLLAGAFLRFKINMLQALFLPASVIGGGVGLLVGPILLNRVASTPLPQDWMTIFSFLPGILIVPVIASIPLGIRSQSADNTIGKTKKNTRYSIIIMFALLSIIGASQNMLGLLTAGAFKLFSDGIDFYPTFGTELAAGFSGGHGTAGVVANMLRNMEQPYWDIAQGLATTTATAGLIGGIIIGIFLINWAVRSGKTNFIQTKIVVKSSQKTGMQEQIAEQEIAGRETTDTSSIDSLTYHLALILSVSGLAFLTTFLLKKANIPFLGFIPEWGYAILIMYLVREGMQKAKITWTLDEKTIVKIRSVFTEYAIVAAIVSLPLQAVYDYFYPLVILIIVGMAMTIVLSLVLSKKMLKQDWFEKSMAIFGTSTGVFLTGIILLRMIDPKMQSTVLRDYSISYSFYSVTSFLLFPVSFGILIQSGLVSGIIFFSIVLLVFTVFLCVIKRAERNSQSLKA